MGIFGSDTFWLLLSLLPACWKIRIPPTSKGWHGALPDFLMPGSIWMHDAIMQVIISQQAAAFRTSRQQGKHSCSWLHHPHFAGPEAHKARELHTPDPLNSCFWLVLGCSPGIPARVCSEMMCRLESVRSTQRVFCERTTGNWGQRTVKLRINPTKHCLIKTGQMMPTPEHTWQTWNKMQKQKWEDE